MRPARADVTPGTNPATNNEMSNDRIAQMIKPVPTPSNGLYDVTSVTPRPIADPIRLKRINKDKNDTTPAKIELHEMLRSASSASARKWDEKPLFVFFRSQHYLSQINLSSLRCS